AGSAEHEITSALHKRRIPGSRSALSRFFARHGITFKKKPPGGRAQASRGGSRVDAGSASKAGLILPASYLSMRQQSPPTWCALTVGARAESAWWRTRPWGTGRQ